MLETNLPILDSWIAVLQRKQGPRLRELDGCSESVQSLVRTCFEMSTRGRPGDGLEFEDDKCSNQLRSARPQVLIASPPCPWFLTLQNHDDGRSIPLEPGDRKVITARLHLIFVVRGYIEQMHRGDRFICEHPWNASAWNEQCFRKLIAQPSVFRIEGPMCRWDLLSGKS